MEVLRPVEEVLREDLEDWEVVLRFLPPGWQDMARETHALRRTRKFPDAESLLRTLLIHLAAGCSLQETALRARQARLADVSGVAVWKRLREAGDWFRWMALALIQHGGDGRAHAALPGDYRARLVDAGIVSKPGSTGIDWRVHYAVELDTLQCDYLEVTDVTGGETFRRYPVSPGDLLIGDRIYTTPPGVAHGVRHGGAVLARLTRTTLPLETEAGRPLTRVPRLGRLRRGAVGEWPCRVALDRRRQAYATGRVCAVRTSRAAANRACAEMLREARKKGRHVHLDTLKLAEYVAVFTTVPPEHLSAAATLELYRGRWQIERIFKRLKSLLALGHLPKKDPQGAKAWLLGKLLVASLLEAFLRAGEAFFPWGYPLDASQRAMR